MNTAIEIQVWCEGDEETCVLAEFPARIGRDELCELHLPYAFVSRRHARIEQHGSRFVLVEEGGCNGISYQGRRLALGEGVEVMDGSEFMIEGLIARLRFIEATQPMRFDDANREHATSLYAEHQLVPEILARVGATTEDVPLALEAQVALHGLQRLAEAFVPDASPLADAASITAFLARVADALRAFVLAKTELEAAQRASETTIEQQVDRNRRLGRELLDWTGASDAVAPRILEDVRAFAAEHRAVAIDRDAVLQQLGGELAPEAIARAAKRAWWHGPFGSQRSWREFVRRHGAAVEMLTGRVEERTVPRAIGALPARAELSLDDISEPEPPAADAHWPFTRGPAWEESFSHAADARV